MPEISWRRVFPGEKRELAAMREWLSGLLPACPERDDLLLVATELGANAIRHTASGRGGQFTVRVTWMAGAVWVAVADDGAPDGPRVINDPLSEHGGRGLRVVQGMSARMGVSGDPGGRQVWADIPWGDAAAAEPASPWADEETIQAGLAGLASRFGVPVWFGRATRQWWALAAPGRDMAAPGQLVAAPTAHDLAGLLRQLPAVSPAPGRRYRGDADPAPGHLAVPGPPPDPPDAPPAGSANHVESTLTDQRGPALSGTGRLADDLWLMAHHEISGKSHLAPRAAGLGLAGALLAELALAGSIGIWPAGIAAGDCPAPADGLARAVLGLVISEREQSTVRDWLLFLARTAEADVAGRLGEAGYLARASSRRPWRGQRWVPVDPTCAFAPVNRALAVLDPSRPAPDTAAALAGLAAACGLGPRVLMYAPPKARRGLEDAAGQLPAGLGCLIAQTRAGVASAVIAHRM
jgi:hypothetical protein